MPVRMTDLLDGWEDGSVELPPPAGMSPERIKERTMEQIRQTKRPRRRMGVRLLACAALAAVRPLLHSGERPAGRRAEGAAGSDRRHQPAPRHQ